MRIIFVVTSEYEIILFPAVETGSRDGDSPLSRSPLPSYPATVVGSLDKTSPDHRDTLTSLVDFHAANRQRYELRNKRRERGRWRGRREIEGEGEKERGGERERDGERGELVRAERMRTVLMLYIIPMTDAPHHLCW